MSGVVCLVHASARSRYRYRGHYGVSCFDAKKQMPNYKQWASQIKRDVPVEFQELIMNDTD